MSGWNDYWGKYSGFSFRGFNLNSKLAIVALVVISVLALSFLGFKTGSYVKTLEKNNTNLTAELTLCNQQFDDSSYALSICNQNLADKQSQLSGATDELSSCANDLNVCQSDSDELQFTIMDLYVQLDRCEDDLSAASSSQSNYDAIKNNYAKDYCCTKNNVGSGQTTYYKLDNNKITCFTNSSSGTTSITC